MNGLLVALGIALAPAASAVTVVARSTAGAAAGVVVVLDPVDGPAPSASAGHAIVDQVQKRFVPFISVIRVGTNVDFPNSDQIRHQVYSFSSAKKFELKLYAGRPSAPVLFDHAGLVVLGCNIHDTMLGFIAVVESPYFGVTGPDGRLTLSAPAGGYRLRAWHPQLSRPIPIEAIRITTGNEELSIDTPLNAHGAYDAPWPE